MWIGDEIVCVFGQVVYQDYGLMVCIGCKWYDGWIWKVLWFVCMGGECVECVVVQQMQGEGGIDV